MSRESAARRRLGSWLPLLLVAGAFSRAAWLSSTGFEIAGDGLAYREIAERLRLVGTAPFVFRPLFPLLVGALPLGSVVVRFGIVVAAAMLAALTSVVRLGRRRPAALLLAVALALSYPVLFNAAYVGRMDSLVLAVQLGFVALALRGAAPGRAQIIYFTMLPLLALVKESLLLGLGPLALLAFGTRRRTWVRVAASSAAFVAIHLGVRAIATVTDSAPAYAAGWLDADRIRLVLDVNLASPVTALDLFAGWGGLTVPVAWLLWRQARHRYRAVWMAPTLLVLIALPVIVAIDLYRAWFELLAPLALFALLQRIASPGEGEAGGGQAGTPSGEGEAGRGDRGIGAAMVLAVAGTALPYFTVVLGEPHLYLQIVSRRLGAGGMLVLALSLAASGLAALRLARR